MANNVDSRRLIDDVGNETSDTSDRDVLIQSIEDHPVYTTQLAALLIIINVCLGAGLLAMPKVMQESGLYAGLIIQAVFLVIIIFTCIMCTELTVKTGVDSYHKIVEAHCNWYVYQFTQASILLMIFGTTIAYIVIIGDQTDRIFATTYGDQFCHTWYMNRNLVMTAVTVLLLIPLCCAKTVDFLKYGSFAGVLSVMFISYVVVKEFIKNGPTPKGFNGWPDHFTNIGSTLPVLCLAYQCQLSWVPTVASVSREMKYKSNITVTFAMIFTSVVYTMVCVLALLTFGPDIEDDLTQNYTEKNWYVLATIGIVAFKAIVTLPPAFLPVRLNLIDILNEVSPSFNASRMVTKRCSVTIVTLLTSLAFSLIVPNILVAVDILGCLSVMFIFVLPAICYLSLIKKMRLEKMRLEGSEAIEPIYSKKDKWKRVLCYFLIIFGFVMGIIVLVESSLKIINSQESEALCKPSANQTIHISSGQHNILRVNLTN